MSLVYVLIIVVILIILTIFNKNFKQKTNLERSFISLNLIIFGGILIISLHFIEIENIYIYFIGLISMIYGLFISLYSLFSSK